MVSSFLLSLFSVRKLRVSPEGYELRVLVPSAWLRQTRKTSVGWWWPSHSTSLATPALRLRYLREFTRGTLCFTAVCGVSFCCSFSFFFFSFLFLLSFFFASPCCYRQHSSTGRPTTVSLFLSISPTSRLRRRPPHGYNMCTLSSPVPFRGTTPAIPCPCFPNTRNLS